MERNQTAKDLFLEYRVAVENAVGAYNHVKTACPGRQFPQMAARIWQLSALAEMWGTTATWLSGGVIDYIQNWREGR